MDSDLELAIRLEANDNGIFDEEIIQNLINEQWNQQSNNTNGNNDQITSVLEETFYMDLTQNLREYMSDSHNYLTTMNDLESILDADDIELINEARQRTVRMQYNLQNVQVVPLQQLQPDPINQFLNAMGLNFGGNMLQMPPQSAFAQLNQFGLGNQPPHIAVFGGATNPLTGLFQQLNPSNFNNQNTQLNTQLNPQLNPLQNLFGNLNNLFNQSVPVVLTDEAIEHLPKLSYEELKDRYPDMEHDEQCVICYSKLTDEKDNYKYTVLPCHHKFHTDCIVPYLKDYNYHCPICREECGDHEPKLD